jgi:hypothetical protein
MLQLYSIGDERMSVEHWWDDTDGETEANKETWHNAGRPPTIPHVLP